MVPREPDGSRVVVALEYYVLPVIREVIISAVIVIRKKLGELRTAVSACLAKIFVSLLVFHQVSHHLLISHILLNLIT